MQSRIYYRNPDGGISFFDPPKDKRLLKKLNWVLTCAAPSVFTLHVFEDWKTKKFRVFVRVSKVREYFEVWWSPEQASVFEPHPEIPRGLLDVSWWNWRSVGFGTKTIRTVVDPDRPWNDIIQEVPVEHCYYLGQYPRMWDTWWHTITSPATSRVDWKFPPTMGEGGLFPLGWTYRDPIPPGVIDKTGTGFPRNWKPGDPNPPNISYDPSFYFQRHFFLSGERFVPFYGPIVPPGWEAVIFGYLPMDATSDIEAEIESLERGLKVDQLQAQTEAGEKVKLWLLGQRTLSPEEIDDIRGTIRSLKSRIEYKKHAPKTETGMKFGDWVEKNLIITEEDLLFFWGGHDYHTYLLQKEWSRLLKNRYINCLAQNYPRT